MSILTEILILEDDELFRHVISDALTDQYKITFCKSITEAFEALQGSFGIILADLNLQGCSSIEFLREAHLKYKIPTVVMSGLIRDRDKQDLQFARFIAKPFTREQIQLVLTECQPQGSC